MRWFVGIFIASCISMGIAVLLSYLPTVQQELNGLDEKFNNENLVDHLVRLPVHLDIQRVDWNHSILSIDLLLDDETVDSTLIYEDLVEISRFGLSSMSNVKQVLVRVFYHEKIDLNHYQMLIAMDAHRDQWSTSDYEQLQRKKRSADQFLQSHFSLYFTKYWENVSDLMNGTL